MSCASEFGADELARIHALAFPLAIREEAADVLRSLPPATHRLDQFFVVSVGDDSVSIPYRIYNPDSSDQTERGDRSLSGLIRSCFYTRHHDGYVRHRSLHHVLDSYEP